MIKNTFIVCSILLLAGCKKNIEYIPYNSIHLIEKKSNEISKKDLEYWYFKDMLDDTVPGISLDKAYSYISETTSLKSNVDKVVIAVIDMSIDIEHEDLTGKIWANRDEIDGNGIDDDDNGYIDDYNGWNFLGGQGNESSEFVNYEYTRILKKYSDYYNTGEDISALSERDRSIFQRTLKKFQERQAYAEEQLKINLSAMSYMTTLDSMANVIFQGSDYDTKMLDSVKKIYDGESIEREYLNNLIEVMNQGVSFEDVKLRLVKSQERINKLLNLNYDDRNIIGDSENDLSDINYGNPKVNHNVSLLDHGTSVAGIIAANRRNDKGANGISDDLLIMPLVVSAYGDENDKDMTLAIRYAVNNGASIINISSGKFFSMHEHWVLEAIKYAADHDVLIVNSAGNESLNLDENSFYPNDEDENGIEVSNNYIKVGSSSNYLNGSLKAASSSFGKKRVDVFAPGVDMYTANARDGNYHFVSGTSFAAAVVSGLAGMLRKYYPKLSAQDIKYILMNSGSAYHVEVPLDENSTLKFNELSKSGRIVNALNALKLAQIIDSKN